MADQIFISYSSQNRSYVDELVKTMGIKGFPTWTDEALRSGDKWARILKEKIDNCVCVVVIMSPSAETSRWVEIETNYAINTGKNVIPLLLEGDNPVFFLQIDHFINVRGGTMPSEEFYESLREYRERWENDEEKRVQDKKTRETALAAFDKAGKTTYECSKCKFPVLYDSITGTAMAMLFGFPFIGSVVAHYLYSWVPATLFFVAAMVGMIVLINKNGTIFKEPSTCPECNWKLQAPLNRNHKLPKANT